MNKKSVLKNYISAPTEKRQKKKEKCACSAITRKGKNVRKSVAKVKKVVQNTHLLNEWAENESSKPEIYLKSLQTVRSNDSVIYIGNCSENRLHSTTPIIDLTRSSSESIHENMDLACSKTLKTIYFPSKNFDRDIKFRKSMATTSLINLPVIRKQRLPRKLKSTTILSCTDKKKLSILDIPQKYLNSPDVSMNSNSFFEKSKLTSADRRMIDWILEAERNIDNTLSPSSSEYNSSLDTDMSRDKINDLYDIDSTETSDQST